MAQADVIDLVSDTRKLTFAWDVLKDVIHAMKRETVNSIVLSVREGTTNPLDAAKLAVLDEIENKFMRAVKKRARLENDLLKGGPK